MRFVPLITCAALFAATACVHKIDIQQGNVVVAEQLAKVKPGMSRADVRLALGTPLLTDAFHANRWDYYFYNSRRGNEVERNRITIVFKDEKVERIEGTAPASIKGEEKMTLPEDLPRSADKKAAGEKK
ncbi:outer membrane protein assembly factor BamE [Usitatibacter palustris]|uniref:Outer membrane protein assembly factor BamE n=1 Tax=Usitatibacter palustris TaxID=2732487 RepID=A0A6M4HDP6_9PROT|nr:outer membrane protein assembly factor BamE [Usitatibacter palustris]QJR16107.1 Outer membrane protein assembly factor BamE [Usitatibacter palustris]